jgi:hypothetical protein
LHAYYVPGLRNRLSLRLTWLWSWATRRRAALLLIDEPEHHTEAPAAAKPAPTHDDSGSQLTPVSRRSARR